MAKILHVRGGSLDPIESTKFLREAALHDYLEKYPGLIPFEEIEDDPPETLVIGREVSVRSGSIDLLIIDASARLTIVETKLAKNPEARREVVGQVIEYASFLSQWTADQVERQAVTYLHCATAEEFYKRLAAEESEEHPAAMTFKAQIEKNLKDGNIRLVIAVDEIVESLRAIVTFLNSFTTFDLVLLQLHDFTLGADEHVFIPTLFGQVKPASGRGGTRVWDEKSFFEESSQVDEKTRRYMRKIYERFAEWTVEPYWGSGAVLGSYNLLADIADTRVRVAKLTSRGDLTINFGVLVGKGFAGRAKELADKLNQIGGIQFGGDQTLKFPKVPRAVLLDDSRLEAVLAAIRECTLATHD